MATSMPSALPSSSRLRSLSVPVAASVINLLMMIPGYSEDGRFQAGPWFAMLAISLAVGLALFAFVVPRAGAVAGLVLGMVALVSVIVFWTGITLPIAAAAAVTGWRARQRGDRRGLATAAVALAGVSAAALIAIIIVDGVSS
jgi:Na+/melibiose symporter-like transporter